MSSDEEFERSHSNLTVTGSRNRGPGALDEEKAGRIRNSLSQAETNSEKRFKKCNIATSSKLVSTFQLKALGGEGAVMGDYMGGRSYYSYKGTAMPDHAGKQVSSMYGPDYEVKYEQKALQQDRLSKFAPTADITKKGTNQSPPVDPTWALVNGFKQTLTNPILPHYGSLMADAAVTYRNIVFRALKDNARSVMSLEDYLNYSPSDDEIKACTQLGLLDAKENAPKAPSDRVRISKFRGFGGCSNN